MLHILTPTDCVRDRLAWFIYHNDFSGMSQAVEVASRQQVDLDLVKKWCDREGAPTKYEIFKANLDAKRKEI